MIGAVIDKLGIVRDQQYIDRSADDRHECVADIELEMNRCGKRHCGQHTYKECQHRKERHNDDLPDTDKFALTFFISISSIDLIF